MLELKNIDVYHGDIQALWDLSLRVDEQELVSLIGANGAGKSTIVETIAGLHTPASGAVVFNGVRLDREPSHRVVELGVCLIPEEKGIFPGMSVLENLELGAFTAESRKVRSQTFRAVYALFPVLQSRRKQAAGTLSGGEQQMLALGRALMSKPKLLMCDEPSLGLAPIIVKAALGLAKRAYVIENGRVAGHGDAGSLLDDERVKGAYLGTG